MLLPDRPTAGEAAADIGQGGVGEEGGARLRLAYEGEIPGHRRTTTSCEKGLVGEALCGTPEYLAPEVILNKGHTFSVDWWCIGILAYECLGCQTPFLSDSDMAMYRKIVKGPADGNISWPKSIPPDARDFIEAQINVDPLKRPGSMKDGALDVKTHKWLAQVDWKKAEARKLEAPWKPKIKSATDASNFDEFDDDAKENFPREDFAKDLFKEFADVWV